MKKETKELVLYSGLGVLAAGAVYLVAFKVDESYHKPTAEANIFNEEDYDFLLGCDEVRTFEPGEYTTRWIVSKKQDISLPNGCEIVSVDDYDDNFLLVTYVNNKRIIGYKMKSDNGYCVYYKLPTNDYEGKTR